MKFNSYIVKGIGGFYYVKKGEELIECKARGIFRKKKISPVAGDFVTIEMEAGQAVIAEILPRKNVFIRPAIANLDILFIVVSTVQPVPSTRIIDKLTTIACNKGVQPILVITKNDLQKDTQLKEIYQNAGFVVIEVDYTQKNLVESFKPYISGKICAFCGNSGVGKSTLINALLPDLKRETGNISEKLGRGKHTTREVELLPMFDGLLADTPGFASLDTGRVLHIPKDDLQYAFPEFEPYWRKCKFTGCTHVAEKGCAVLQALEQQKIQPTRYESYKLLYQEAKEVNQWELPQKKGV